MKKTSLLFAVIASCATAAFAQNKAKESDIPIAVKTAFDKQFPAAKPEWEKENGRFEAEFRQEGKEISAVFDADGILLETEKEIKVENLPAAAAAYIKKNYGGVSVKEAAKIISSQNIVTYEAEVKGKDLIFDAQGNFIKEEKD